MAGIYIHIPFCKKACHYCDFHFSTNQAMQKNMVDAICEELENQKYFLGNEQIETIYFGGGTPSLLAEVELAQILNTIYKNYNVICKPEITLEANPDDIQENNLKLYFTLGINRLSIGIQSFNNKVLKWMNRAHDANQAFESVKNAKDVGFDNITVDLIYAIPNQKDIFLNYSFEQDLEKIIALDVSHISAYNLTIEPKTTFGKWKRLGKIDAIEDEIANNQFDLLISELAKNGFEQYEISNFAKNKRYAKHNTAYWFEKKYLGVGPSAHSFDGIFRFANVSNNSKYVKAIEQKSQHQTIEKLTNIDFANEHLLTRLRTQWGADLDYISTKLSRNELSIFMLSLEKQIKSSNLLLENNSIFLTQNGKKIADTITSNLFT